MIQDVEEIASELQRNPFCETELATQRDIPLSGAEAAQSIVPQIALRGGGHGRGKGRRVDDFASGDARWIKIERHAGNNIRALHAVRTGCEGSPEELFLSPHLPGERCGHR